jgi:excisionase family DNA binding protein
MNDSPFLNISQAADFLRLSVPQIYRLTSEHRIPFIKCGKRVIFSADKLRKWMEAQAVEAAG